MEFFMGLLAIIFTNVILSGDNAVVIAMAARTLPENLQKKAVIFGSVGAIVLRVLLTALAAYLLQLPYLRLVGGLLLCYIGVSLLNEDDDEKTGEDNHNAGMWGAIRLIIIADLVMSLDNVLAVAAAAKGSWALLIIGLGLSIPLIIFGSTLLMKVMAKMPWLVTAGAALIGYLAGEMIFTDPVTLSFLPVSAHSPMAYVFGGVFAIGTVIAGKLTNAVP